jgi:hypothetical protein
MPRSELPRHIVTGPEIEIMPVNRCRRWQMMALVAACIATTHTVAAVTDGETTATDARPGAAAPSAASAAAAKGTDKAAEARSYATEALRGRVVWMAEALKRRFRIETDADAAETVAALETNDGRLYPIVKDVRGRGFWLDPRLRGIDVELVVRRYEGSPAVQIVRWYAIREGRKYELDYWCDTCAIPMYELKTCDCCQGKTRLRERLAEETAP